MLKKMNLTKVSIAAVVFCGVWYLWKRNRTIEKMTQGEVVGGERNVGGGMGIDSHPKTFEKGYNGIEQVRLDSQ